MKSLCLAFALACLSGATLAQAKNDKTVPPQCGETPLSQMTREQISACETLEGIEKWQKHWLNNAAQTPPTNAQPGIRDNRDILLPPPPRR